MFDALKKIMNFINWSIFQNVKTDFVCRMKKLNIFCRSLTSLLKNEKGLPNLFIFLCLLFVLSYRDALALLSYYESCCSLYFSNFDQIGGLYTLASWLEEISRRHSELLAAQDSIDRLQERERILCTENESIKVYYLHFQGFIGTICTKLKNSILASAVQERSRPLEVLPGFRCLLQSSWHSTAKTSTT